MTQRIIKFRAWDKERKEFLNYFDIGCKGMIICEEKNEPQNIELMQFTGLLDKNGKEIYESDVLQCFDKRDDGSILLVKWIEHLAGWYYVDGTCKDGEWISQLGMYDNGEEIIGNIYEHPTLLT